MRDKRILIFAGTTEGRKLAEYLSQRKVRIHICTATAYGESLLPSGEGITVSHTRMDEERMAAFIKEFSPQFVVDATHPYAQEVTENIKDACRLCGIEYIRLLRAAGDAGDCIYVKDIEAGIEYLKQTTGNILVTTGSKELKKYMQIPDYRARIYARVLSVPEVVIQCSELGFEGKHLICMQGPFTREMNLAMLRAFDISYLVTKESGSTGGFPEKYEAAMEAGCRLLVIGRPNEEVGYGFGKCIEYLLESLNLEVKRKAVLVGIGMGNPDTLTIEARKVCEKADLIIGAKRMVQAVAKKGQHTFCAYRPEDIAAYIEEHRQFETIVIAMSGDVGFFSGAKKILSILESIKITETVLLPGITSVSYFAAKLGKSWEDAALTSIHGREENLIGIICRNEKTFVLTGRPSDLRDICSRLQWYGMGGLRVWCGENLSYEDERILEGRAADFTEYEGNGLSVLYVENPNADKSIAAAGISDDEFLRGKVPMTKEEVRIISIAKLKLQEESLVYDIGAGTGSVSVQAALQVNKGQVYAIEKNVEAVKLLHGNKQKFGVDNMSIVEGEAPEALQNLPVPSHVFIGGSQGKLKEILALVFRKNQSARIVVNVIAAETFAEVMMCEEVKQAKDLEILQITAAKSKEAGRYHMMLGQNPVYIISFTGNAKGEGA